MRPRLCQWRIELRYGGSDLLDPSQFRKRVDLVRLKRCDEGLLISL